MEHYCKVLPSFTISSNDIFWLHNIYQDQGQLNFNAVNIQKLNSLFLENICRLELKWVTAHFLTHPQMSTHMNLLTAGLTSSTSPVHESTLAQCFHPSAQRLFYIVHFTHNRCFYLFGSEY